MKLLMILLFLLSNAVFAQFHYNRFGLTIGQIVGNKTSYDKTKIGLQANGYNYYIIPDEEFDSALTFVYRANANVNLLKKSQDAYGTNNQFHEIDLRVNPAYNFVFGPYFGFISPYARYTNNSDRHSMTGGMGVSISSEIYVGDSEGAFYVHAGGLFGQDFSNKLIQNFDGDLTFLEYTYISNGPISTNKQYIVTNDSGTVDDRLDELVNDYPDMFDEESVIVREISLDELLESHEGFYISLGVLNGLNLKNRPINLQLDLSNVSAKVGTPGKQTSMSPVEVTTTTEIINGQPVNTDTYIYRDVKVITNSHNEVKYNRFELDLNAEMKLNNKISVSARPSLGLEKVKTQGGTQRRKNVGFTGGVLINF